MLHETDRSSSALIDKCVHYGFCLPTCPTYMLWGEEMDSPRARIYLMKAAIEGRTAVDATFVRHIDACLGCLNCVTACPSGVEYGPLIERTRAQVEAQFTRSVSDRLFRRALLALVPYPSRMRVALAPLALFGGLVRAFASSDAGRVLPERVRAAMNRFVKTAVVARQCFEIALQGLFGRDELQQISNEIAQTQVDIGKINELYTQLLHQIMALQRLAREDGEAAPTAPAPTPAAAKTKHSSSTKR